MSTVSQKFLLHDVLSEALTVKPLVSALEISSQYAQVFDVPEVDAGYINEIAEMIKAKFKTMVIIGTGASSIIPRVLFSLSVNAKINIKFLEDLDSLKLDAVLSSIVAEVTCFLVISKSGRTREVLELFSVCSRWLENKLGADIGKHIYCITRNQADNVLLSATKKYSHTTILEHPSLAGRYSFFSCLGLLPAALAGFNIEMIITQAKIFLSHIDKHSWVLDSASYFIKMSKKYSNVVFMTYSSLFQGLALWFRQLVSESLGKQGGGINPVIFEGNIDQHSQLQAYVDGLPDKFFILIMPSFKLYQSIVALGQLHCVSADIANSLWQANYLQIQSVLNILTQARKNIQVIEVNVIDEQFLATMAGNFMLKTILYAVLNEMDPFSQTAVDSMKALSL